MIVEHVVAAKCPSSRTDAFGAIVNAGTGRSRRSTDDFVSGWLAGSSSAACVVHPHIVGTFLPGGRISPSAALITVGTKVLIGNALSLTITGDTHGAKRTVVRIVNVVAALTKTGTVDAAGLIIHTSRSRYSRHDGDSSSQNDELGDHDGCICHVTCVQ